MKYLREAACVLALFALIGAQALFVAAYTGHEHTIYFWDHAMYFGMARQFHALLGQNFSAGWAFFKNALAGNYNLIFALPSLASFELFGPSRLVFILTNFFAFYLAYEFAVAFLLRRAFDFGWNVALIASFVASSLVPPLWLPLLEGYPDIGAAACIVLAAALALGQPWQRRAISRGLVPGLVLAFAVLLRRHFVYAALALLITGAGFALWDIGRTAKGRWPKLGHAALYFTGCGASFAGLLALIAPEFLQTALTTDYGALYRSYHRPPYVFLRFAAGGFGWGLVLLAVSGLLLGARANKEARKPVAFLALYAFSWLVIWCGGPGQMGHHYILQALPLFVIAGLAGWFAFLAGQQRIIKYAAGGALLAGLIVNSAWALWFSPTGVWPNDNGKPGLLSAPRPPVVRTDYDEWLRLAEYLRRTTRPTDHIMLIGSSFVFNLDLLHSIYADILGAPEMTLRFPKSPEIDHEEPAPLDVFAASDVYLVPAPAQYHLDPEGQRVVTAAALQFPPPASRASMFHADGPVFHLADQVSVRVWRRDPWVPDKLHAALKDIRRVAPQDANFDQDWVTTALPLWAQIHTFADHSTSVAGILGPGRESLRLLLDTPLAAGNYRLGFSAASDCADPRFHFDVLAGGGPVETGKDFTPALLPGAAFQSFTVPRSPQSPPGDYFLQLGFSSAAETLCRTELRGLRVERMP